MNNAAPERIRLVKRDGRFANEWYYPDAAIMPYESEFQYRLVDPPAAPTDDLTVLDVLRAATNYVINPAAKREQSAAESRELIIKGLMWAIHEVESASTPAAPDERDDYVAWCRYVDDGNRIVLCNSDSKGAFKVYRESTLATVRAEVWRDAMKIIDDAGEGWGVQARDRKSKTYSAYVIAALDLKGRFDESARTGKGGRVNEGPTG